MKNNKFVWTSILTAIGASLCCITPILALISGASGIASSFSRLEPLRPYFIGITVLVLIFAWYRKLKPKKEIECDCEVDKKPKFMQTKLFLGLVTGFAVIMLAFPYYGNIFYQNTKKDEIKVEQVNIEKVEIRIEGMTCDACQTHVNHAVNELSGILNVNSSYVKGNAFVEFDKTQITIEDIEKSINSTGYKVIKK